MKGAGKHKLGSRRYSWSWFKFTEIWISLSKVIFATGDRELEELATFQTITITISGYSFLDQSLRK